jgi:hypothetical protein
VKKANGDGVSRERGIKGLKRAFVPRAPTISGEYWDSGAARLAGFEKLGLHGASSRSRAWSVAVLSRPAIVWDIARICEQLANERRATEQQTHSMSIQFYNACQMPARYQQIVGRHDEEA